MQLANQYEEGYWILFEKLKQSLKQSHSKKKIIISIATVSIIIISVFAIYFLLQLSFNTQYPVVIVISDSMEPNIHRGDLLFVRGIPPEDIRNGTIEDQDGDIVVFDARGLWEGAPNDPVVHRVVNKWYNDTTQKWYFYTKGDANFHIDMAVIPEDRIYGIVFGGIPYIGLIKIVLIDAGLYFFFIIFIVILLIISIIRDIIKDDNYDEKKENNDNLSDK